MNANQTLTLATAQSTGNEWSTSETTTLKLMKLQGASIAEIAVTLGRTYYAVSTRLGVTGLATPRPRAIKPAKVETACDACWLIHRGECA